MLLIFCFVELELAGELVGELAVGPGVERAVEHSVECSVLERGFESAVGHAVDLLLC